MKYLFSISLSLFLLSGYVALAQTGITTKSWKGSEFDAFQAEVAKGNDLNLLTFPGAKLHKADQVNNQNDLTDGEVGSFGGEGRVNINGRPSTIVYYLGKPQTITEIRISSGNIDSRGNQDFEVRLANNEKNPGKQPQFPKDATFTSGDKILGNNGGGFMSTIADSSGKPISGDKKYDWVEFKLWQSYPSKAGDPAKDKSPANNWASYVELQVIGDENDPNLFASQQDRDNWLADRERAKFMRLFGEKIGEDVIAAMNNPDSLRRAINDLTKKYPDKYDGKNFLARLDEIAPKFADLPKATVKDLDNYVALAEKFTELRKEALLANPLMKFEKLLFRRAQNAGLTANWISNAARGKGGYGNALAIVDPQDAGGEAKTIIENPNNSFVGDISLHWDADKMLVTGLGEDKTWQVFELNTDGTGYKQVTPSMGKDVDNVEGCYVPDGSTLFISTASMMGVPCIDGSSQVGNIYRLEQDGKTIRQLTFEQDQDWCPVLLPNGRVMYLRWEYTDTSHYFTRILFHMNPDGTNQVEYYGSNSFWPNSLFYAKPIPGSSTKFVSVVTGHHGVGRMGELYTFDIQKGRQEAQGAIQQIPGYGKPVNPIIKDQLVDDSWPKFLFPSPLDENYYLVTAQLKPGSPWCIYLVDTFDNMLKIREEKGFGLYEPTPLIKRPQPQIQPNRVDPDSKESNVFVTDVYFGDGLKDVPKGTVKKLRVFAYHFGYRGIGGHDYFGMESCWDARRMLGEVPVYEDGSASFVVPPNTPLAIQPLDDDGRALQIMRTWFVGMPGENQSCTGCHESQNTVTPNKKTVAMGKAPTPIEPFLGAERPFAFKYEVQPVLDQYCVGCHNGETDKKTMEDKPIPNFADTTPGHRGFSKSYHALHPYVRRPGPESETHMFKPLEYHASASELFQRLAKGHHGVKVDHDSMRRLYAWADLNVPYFGTWIEVAEVHKKKSPELVPAISARYNELKTMYAGIDLDPEKEPYSMIKLPEKIDFVKPTEVKLDYSAPTVANWPFDAAKAKSMQTKSKQTVKSGDVEFEMAWIPSGKFVMGDENGFADELPRSEAEIKKPFWMATVEVTNELYNQFDPKHDSRFIDQWWKDHTTPGYAANNPKQPVIRVTQEQAVEFCKWLSQKTGKKFRLPTETEWEWACRAGSATPMWYGGIMDDFGKLENMSDMTTKKFVVRGVNPQPIGNPPDVEAFIPRAEGVDDGQMIEGNVGGYEANPWGLHDMHGSVAEWTSSNYQKADDIKSSNNQRAGDVKSPKVVRGGSWRDKPYMSRSGIRRPFEPWQYVYNVGFRVVCDE